MPLNRRKGHNGPETSTLCQLLGMHHFSDIISTISQSSISYFFNISPAPESTAEARVSFQASPMYGEALLHRQDCEDDDDDDGTHGKGYDSFDVVDSASAGHRLVSDCRKEGCEDL